MYSKNFTSQFFFDILTGLLKRHEEPMVVDYAANHSIQGTLQTRSDIPSGEVDSIISVQHKYTWAVAEGTRPGSPCMQRIGRGGGDTRQGGKV